jgi:hypothetical protein
VNEKGILFELDRCMKVNMAESADENQSRNLLVGQVSCLAFIQQERTVKKKNPVKSGFEFIEQTRPKRLR